MQQFGPLNPNISNVQALYAGQNMQNGGTTMILGQMSSNNSLNLAQNADTTRQNQNFKYQNTVKSAQNTVLNTQKPSLANSAADTYPIKAEEGQRAVQDTSNGDVFENSKKKRMKKIAVAAGIIAAGALLLAAYMRFGKTKNTPPAPSNSAELNPHKDFSNFTRGKNAQREDASSILDSNNAPSENGINSFTEQGSAESAPKENLRIRITSNRDKIQIQTEQNNQPDNAPRITIHDNNGLNQDSGRLTSENTVQEGAPRIIIHQEEAKIADLSDVNNSTQGVNQETARLSQGRNANGLSAIKPEGTAENGCGFTILPKGTVDENIRKEYKAEIARTRELWGDKFKINNIHESGIKFKNVEEIRKILDKQNITAEDLRSIEAIFKKHTGIELHCADSYNIKDFISFFMETMRYNNYQNLGPDIRHIVIGHGIGNVEGGIRWQFEGNHIGVFDYINSHIPRGEKVLAVVCSSKPLDRPDLLGAVTANLRDPEKPGKIIVSGENKIIGTTTLLKPNDVSYFKR